MPNYAFTVPPTPSVSIFGSDLEFPVHRIYCVGRNYAEHAREMGADPDREPPFFFCKPADAVVSNDSKIPYPQGTKNFHHEIELVVAIGKGGREISEAAALDHVFGYAVGIDLTRRDLQLSARDKGRPWDAGKAFDQSAPLSSIHLTAETGRELTGGIWIEVNGQIRQKADLSALVWSVPEVIAHLSGLYVLQPGDLIFTGTPAGVGAVVPGDKLRGGIDGLDEIRIEISE
jgi:fumarylpyruvate hydrolase